MYENQNHFWLIQRGKFRDLSKATALFGTKEIHLINGDYMGSAEFEWGAIPKAYRRIMGQYDKYKLHITDLKTVSGVPLYLFCEDENYELILAEIKLYLEKEYRLKEWTNLHAHFRETSGPASSYDKHRLETNFWWCIDRYYQNEQGRIGDWMAFLGAADREKAFLRCIENDYRNWWMEKSEEEREEEFKKSFRNP